MFMYIISQPPLVGVGGGEIDIPLLKMIKHVDDVSTYFE